MRALILMALIVIQLIILIIVINTEENKIAELEQTTLAQERLLIASDSMVNTLLVRNDELSEANEALMKYATPASCIRAIKHTLLPKIKYNK